MKNKFLLVVAGAMIMTGFENCKKPTENVKLNINNGVFTNFVYVKVRDFDNPNTFPARATVSISGPDADYIYNTAGTKDYVLNKDGTIALAVDPRRVPTEANPLDIIISASSNASLPVSQEILIDGKQKTKNVTLNMVSLSKPPQGYAYETRDFSLTGGVIPGPKTVGSKTTADSVYYSDDNTTVVLPAGTDFYYYKSVKSTRIDQPISNDYTLNGIQKSGKAYRLYDAMVDYKYEKVKYTGGELKVVCLYTNVSNTNVRLTPINSGNEDNASIKLLNGQTVKYSELLYTNSVRKVLYDVYFLGKDDKGNYIHISPSVNSKWFTSYNLDPNTINPLTNAKIKAGDLIEVGIDYATNTSVYDTIREAKNKQLRVEAKTFNAGYFYRAEYTQNFSFTMNPIQPTTIPDLENLSSSVNINYGAGNLNYGFNPSSVSQPIRLEGKIASKDPITVGQADVALFYCSKNVAQYKVNQGVPVNIFEDRNFQSLPPVTTFHLTMKCLNNNIIVHPDYYAQVYSSNTGQYFYCNVVKGLWSTRGVRAGETYNISGYVNGYLLTDVLSVASGSNEVYKELKGDEYICKGL
jgi:hypothetical protein